MKFLQSHRKDLLQKMYVAGLLPEQFDYVNKRGRIHIIQRDTKNSFSYFRIKDTQLDPNSKRWVESEKYETSIDQSKPVSVNNWSEVLEAFEKWISKLYPEGYLG